MKSNPIFGFPIPVFPVQYATFTELPLTIRGVSYSLPHIMIALFGPLKNGFWGQKRKIWPSWANRPQRNTPTTERRFWMHWAKIHTSHGSCGRIEGTKKKLKKHARVQLHRYAHPTPFSAATIFCMWGRTVDVIKHVRFQLNRFRGFGAPGGRKWPSPIDLAHRPYNSVRTNVLHCEPFHRYWGVPKSPYLIIYWQNLHCACAVSRDT